MPTTTTEHAVEKPEKVHKSGEKNAVQVHSAG
jgi:hypothetical protein